MSKDPAFLFYPNDYIGGTMGMTLEEKGAYMELLMMQFNRGHMTSHMIGQTVGQLWDTIQVKFIQDAEGLWFNEWLEKEQIRRKKFTESRHNNVKGRNQHTKKNNKTLGHMTSHMETETETETEDETITETGTETEDETGTDTITETGIKKKENSIKKKENKIQFVSEFKNSNEILEQITYTFWALFKFNKQRYGVPNSTDLEKSRAGPWLKQVRLLIEKDGRTEQEIRLVYDFLKNEQPGKNGFAWSGTVKSIGSLREHFEDILLRTNTQYPNKVNPLMNTGEEAKRISKQDQNG